MRIVDPHSLAGKRPFVTELGRKNDVTRCCNISRLVTYVIRRKGTDAVNLKLMSFASRPERMLR